MGQYSEEQLVWQPEDGDVGDFCRAALVKIFDLIFGVFWGGGLYAAM